MEQTGIVKNIGFVATRLAGTDGVTLEASKWAQVLRSMGHKCFWFAGLLDKTPAHSMLVPEAFFGHERNLYINKSILGCQIRKPDVTRSIQDLTALLKRRLWDFIRDFRLDMLIVENALTIPMHIPLGLALTEMIAENKMPVIAHHHDFYWERTRFSINAVGDYLRMAFPPNLPHMAHVVINSAAQEELALRTGVSSMIIPNILDFDQPPSANNGCSQYLRASLGLAPDDIIFLQPTRVVQRKGIEHAIELVKNFGQPNIKLVISHETGDEGYEYADWLRLETEREGVDLRFLTTHMRDPWNETKFPQDAYSLFDIYPMADFVTYPSLYEGFGNAFLEAVYFKKPLLINRYATFVSDIEPKGFDLVVMDGFLTRKNVDQVREILKTPERRERMVAHNYTVARRHYSYGILRRWLNVLMANFFGVGN